MEWTEKRLIASSLVLTALLILGTVSTPAIDMSNNLAEDDASFADGTPKGEVGDGTSVIDPGPESPVTPTKKVENENHQFCIKIHKIEKLDSLDSMGSAEWYYKLKVSDDGGSNWDVRESSEPLNDSKDTMIVGDEHVFDVTGDRILFRIILKDKDVALDDTADISARPDQGWFNDDGRKFQGVFWMNNHTLGGDRTEENEIHWVETSGEWDDSGEDVDTNILFDVYEKGKPDIKRPIFTIPKIQERGKNIEVTVTASEEPNSWSVKLSSPYEYPKELDIQDINRTNDDRWEIRCRIPDSIESGLYDLTVKNEFGSDSEYHAVQVSDKIDDEFKFIHMSDLHIGYDEEFYSIANVKRAIREANLINPDFVFITGDVCDKVMGWYKDQQPDPMDQDRRALQLLQRFEVPIYVGSGNHDWSYDGYDDDRQNIESYKRWVNPNLNFSFDYGDYHFSYMDTKSYVCWLNPDSPMTTSGIDWLQKDLEKNMDMAQRFVGYHHPVYPDTFDDDTVKARLAQTLIDYNVSMALTGHTHIQSIHDAHGNEQTGQIGDPAHPLHATVSDIEGGHDYRLIRVEGERIANYTYDKDGDGIRPANSSIPLGNLSVDYSPSNDGESQRVVATIENDLYEYFKDASLPFKVPDDGSDYTVENGSIKDVKDLGSYLRFSVEVDIPKNTTKKVSIEPSNYLKADFSWSPEDPIVTESVHFSPGVDSQNSITSWSWDFGDDSSSTTSDPSHIYSSSGTYTVSMTVEDTQGNIATSTKQLTVDPEQDDDSEKLDEDFEDNTSGWSTSGLWHLVDDSDQYGDSHSQSHSMWYGQDSTGNYDTGSRTTGSLSRSVDLTDTSQAELSFYHWFETESYNGEYDQVKVTVNDDEVYYRDTSDDNVGSEDDFVKETINVSDYTGQAVQLSFVFDSKDDYDNSFRGWYVDDVKLITDSGQDEDDHDGDEDEDSSGSVVLSEVYYDVEGTDSDGEYIEMYNQGSETVNLSGWTIGDDTSSNYTFEDSDVITGHSYLTLCRDRTTFKDRYNKTPDAWDLYLSLNNGGDSLTLYDSNAQIVDKTGWEQGKWSDLSASTGEVIRRDNPDKDTDTVNDWITGQPAPQVMSDGPFSPGTLMSEDFEGGTSSWSTSGLWHLTEDSNQYGEANSGSNSMWYGKGSTGNYDTGSRTHGALKSPTIELKDVSEAYLRFSHWFETESYDDGHYDILKVFVNGQKVYYRDTTDDNVGSENDFVEEVINLSDHAGEEVEIEFVFDSVDDYDNDHRGWYLDDVEIMTE